MNRAIGFLVGLLLVGGASAGAADQAAEKSAAQKSEAVFWPAKDVKWTPDPEGSGIQTAVTWGDPKKGAYGVLIKFPAGMVLPLHHHTHENKGAVISGTFVVTPEGGKAQELGAGSYLVVPGGMKHTTACRAGADCVVFGMQPGPDDMIPAAAPPAKK